MYEFIVLGLVPGTDIELGFYLWAILSGMIALTYICWRIHVVRAATHWIIALSLRQQIRQNSPS